MARTAAERSALAAKVQQAQEIAERAIAGGMAHEIRNAVGGSVLVLSHLRDQELFSRSRAELEELFEKLKSQRERLNEDFPRMAQQCALIASALEEAEGAMEVVLSNDERAVALTSRVLDLSRVERALGAETVDVHALVREVVEGAHHSHPNVEMVAQCNGDGVFRGHADLLFAVIQNLLLNAVDAVMRQPEEGNRRVVVNSTLDSTSGRDSWRLMVADNGVGINAEQKAHIFDPFYSAKPQRGTGLGLYLVRRVVSAYHGEIRVESEEGKGTTFTLYLPLRSVSDLLTAARSPERGADTAASPDNASADAKTIASLGTQ
jgi:signal transduction histidine kinase